MGMWAEDLTEITLGTTAITFSDFSNAGSDYNNGKERSFAVSGSDGKSYTFKGLNVMKVNSTGSKVLQMKSGSSNILTLPKITSSKGFEIKVTYSATKSAVIKINSSSASNGTTVSSASNSGKGCTITASTNDTEATVIIGDQNTQYVSEIVITPKGGASENIPHDIVLNKSIGGVISADKTTAIAGETITLSQTPADGYSFVGWDVRDVDNNTVAVANNSFEMPTTSVYITATFSENITGTYVEWDMTKAKSLKTDITGGISFESAYVTMTALTNGGTSASNYLGGNGSYDHTRFYSKNIIGFTPADGYQIESVKIVLSSSSGGASNWTGGVLSNCTAKSSNANTSAGTPGFVTLTPIDVTKEFNVKLNGNTNIELVRVIYSEIPTEYGISINDCGNASLSTCYPLDFTNVEGVKAYMVTAETAESITLTEIKKVPANTGIFVLGEGGTYDIPVLNGEADDASANKLVATITPKAVIPAENIWALSKNDGKLHPVTSGTIGTGKAYLVSTINNTAAARGFAFVDDENTTGINSAATVKATGVAFNLAGQRVAPNAKGIVIVNGKKFINK